MNLVLQQDYENGLNPKMNPLEEIPQIKSERLVVDDPDSSLTEAMQDYKHREGIV